MMTGSGPFGAIGKSSRLGVVEAHDDLPPADDHDPCITPILTITRNHAMKTSLQPGRLALALVALPFALHAQPAAADEHAGHSHHDAPAAPAAAASAATTSTAGEVRKVDRAQGKLTLRHGPIVNLDMPAMTMAFKVADAKMLDGLKEGDQVSFSARRIQGALTITAISPSPAAR